MCGGGRGDEGESKGVGEGRVGHNRRQSLSITASNGLIKSLPYVLCILC